MDIGTVLSIAQSLLGALHSKEVQGMCSMLGYKSELKDLEETVSTVKAVLLDAENKEGLSHKAQIYIEELKDAVVDADDLFDKFVTKVQQKQLIKGGKASKNVSTFFSRNNPLAIAYSMSQGVKKIRKKLDAANNHAQFGFSIDPQPIRQRREETCSYVYKNNIIGREKDVEDIVGYLLNDTKKDVSFLTIVGIGGLGKTALAQLVYNDARVASAFPLKIWTCVSDHDQEPLDVGQILRNILISAKKNHEGSNMESLQSQVRTLLTVKYLLVLDDVWTESQYHWSKLEEFLLEGPQGSWIVLTTRSLKTASIMKNGSITHELQGLSKENSWCLFKEIAFGSTKSNPQEDLVKIGEEIVEGCARVPLAIRVAGSLLNGQEKSKWLSFQKIGLSNSKEGQTDIMSILKLSYHQLESPIKSCFTYCTLFPKDYELDKFILKRLWIAQGYIVPSNDSQSVEEVAEDYFTVLLRRCFFQDVTCTDFGHVESCKIHDLMHDIGQSVAGKEICPPDFAIDDTDNNARHLAYTSPKIMQQSFTKTRLRSYLYVGPLYTSSGIEVSTSTLKALFSNWICLRVLDLSDSGIKCLPDSISKLLHLRYLDICGNSNLEVLPQSISKLYNLQTLRLGGCPSLKELPSDFIKLVNLRTLEIVSCGINNLACLGALTSLNYLQLFNLQELEYIIENGELGGCINASTPEGRLRTEGFSGFACLETLQLYHLMKLKGWRNSRVKVGDDCISSSSMALVVLPQLKSFQIINCKNMKCNMLLPNLEEVYLLTFNKNLQVNNPSKDIGNENVNKDSSSISASGSGNENAEEDSSSISASNTGNENAEEDSSISASSCWSVPKLRKVFIDNAAWLNRMPVESFQCLDTLIISGDKKLECLVEVKELFRSCSSSLVSLTIKCCPELQSVMFGGLEYLTVLEKLVIESSYKLIISDGEEEEEDDDDDDDKEREDGNEIGLPWPPLHKTLRHLSLEELSLVNLPNWMQFLSALKTLKIDDCTGLETMPQWMPKLTSLKELRLLKCSKSLNERCQKSNGEDWPLIQQIPSIQIVENSDYW